MKHSYLITGVRFRNLHRLLLRNHCSPTPRTFLRYMILLHNSLWSSFFSTRDHLLCGKAIANYQLPEDPVFIVGHWRTGSTFLHHLLAQDPELNAPSLYQTALPEAFITARPWYAPIMRRFVGKSRPFDNVKAGIDEPQECEFALFRMTTDSPLERLLFPRTHDYFLLQDVGFIPQGEKEKRWEEAMRQFYCKISWLSKKRLVLKNPFHSMRIEVLRKNYPNAKFIHIYRDPHSVVPSTVRMWSIVGLHNTMNRKWRPPALDEVAAFYKYMFNELKDKETRVPQGQWANIRYEDLAADPVECLRQTYTTLGLPFSPSFAENIRKYMDETRDFQKNRHNLSPEDRACIRQELGDVLPEYFN